MKRSVIRRLSPALLALALGAASAPAGALAAGPGSTKAPKHKPKPALKPINPGRVAVELTGLFNVHQDSVTVPQRPVVVTGTVQRFVPGQKVSLFLTVDGHQFKRLNLSIARHGQRGQFSATIRAPRAGRVTVRAYHERNTKMLSFESWKSFTTLDTTVTLGTSGRFVQLVQQQLAALHLFIPQTGVFDNGTELALDAYHRLLGKGEGHMTLDPPTLTALLDGKGSFHVLHPDQGSHAEGDLSDQVLAFINGSQVHWLFPISSGKPSTPTILGDFQIYYKEPEYTSDGMYFSSFFHGGYAIHGYNPAPDYPASHGCMRLPIVDAIPAFSWTRVGDWVDTYYT
jgi:L,D-transpeptidase catalytic domain